MTSFAVTSVRVNVTEVVDFAPVWVTIVGVVMSRPQHVYAAVVPAPIVNVIVDAPVVPVQVMSPATDPPWALPLEAHAPVPLAGENIVPADTIGP